MDMTCFTVHSHWEIAYWLFVSWCIHVIRAC